MKYKFKVGGNLYVQIDAKSVSGAWYELFRSHKEYLEHYGYVVFCGCVIESGDLDE